MLPVNMFIETTCNSTLEKLISMWPALHGLPLLSPYFTDPSLPQLSLAPRSCLLDPSHFTIWPS